MATTTTIQLAQALMELTDSTSSPQAAGKTEAEVHTAVKEFAAYLNKKGMLKQAPKIMREYQTLYNTKHNIVEALVTAAQPLTDNAKQSLIESLKKKYTASEVHLVEKVDSRLLGGMKIKIGDEVYDSSLKHSLTALQAQLLK